MNSIDQKAHCLRVKLNLLALSPPCPETGWITLLFSLFICQRNFSTLELNPEARVPLASNQVLSSGELVGLGGFEPPTSRLSGVRSNQTEL